MAKGDAGKARQMHLKALSIKKFMLLTWHPNLVIHNRRTKRFKQLKQQEQKT
tara:strand:- start:183 stop:338 length:156 start_codon:yes stop_codon:yes gene_type:complete